MSMEAKGYTYSCWLCIFEQLWCTTHVLRYWRKKKKYWKQWQAAGSGKHWYDTQNRPEECWLCVVFYLSNDQKSRSCLSCTSCRNVSSVTIIYTWCQYRNLVWTLRYWRYGLTFLSVNVFRYCLSVCVSPSVRVWDNHKLVRIITYHPFKLG